MEKPTLSKKPSLRWEEKRTAVLQGGPLFLGGVIPEGQVPTWGLSPWWCVTRECSRRSVGELQLLVSSDCSLWKSAVTQPILTAVRPVCHKQLQLPGCPFWTAGLLSGLLCHDFGSFQLYEGQQCWQAQTALVQLGALVCIPWLLLIQQSPSHRWLQTSNQEQQLTQSKYKVIWHGRNSLVKQRVPSQDLAEVEVNNILHCDVFSVLPGNLRLWILVAVPVWRQQFVPVVIRTGSSDFLSYTKDENGLNLSFCCGPKPYSKHWRFPSTVERERLVTLHSAPGGFCTCFSFHSLPGWEGFRMLRSQPFVDRK